MIRYTPPVSIDELKEMKNFSSYENSIIESAYRKVIFEIKDLENRILSSPYIKSLEETLNAKISLLELEITSINTEIELLKEKFINEDLYEWCKELVDDIGEKTFYEYVDFNGVFFINFFIKDLKKVRKYKKRLSEIEDKIVFKLEKKPSYIIRNNENLELLIANLESKKSKNKSYIFEIKKDFDIMNNIEKYKNNLKMYDNTLYFIEKVSKQISKNDD